MGRVETSKGTFLFDGEAAASVLAAYEAQGNELCIDYEHRAVDPEARAGDGKAAGWFRLELRADGLYAVDVRWTPAASAALTAREYRYFSPAFTADNETGRILELINIALTNIPATRNMTPLVASRDTTMATESKDEALEAARAKKLEDAKGRHAKARAELEAAEAELSAFVPKPATEESSKAPPPEPKQEETARPSAPFTNSGDPPPPRDSDAEEKASAVAASRAELLTKVLASNAELIASNKRLEAQLASMQREKTVTEVTSVVAESVKAGRILPALRDDFIKLGCSDRALFDTMLAKTTPVVAMSGGGGAHAEPAPERGATLLTEDARKMCTHMGIDPKAFAEFCSRSSRKTA